MQTKQVFSHMILHSYLCNALCKSSIKIESNYCFSKRYSESKARDQLIHAKKELFCRVIVKNYLRNVLCKFLIKMEARGGAKSKTDTPVDFTVLW